MKTEKRKTACRKIERWRGEGEQQEQQHHHQCEANNKETKAFSDIRKEQTPPFFYHFFSFDHL
jgi:hypothetical protein